MLDVIVLLLLVSPVIDALHILAYRWCERYYPSGVIAAILRVVASLLAGAGPSLRVAFLNAGSGSRHGISLTQAR